MTKISKLTELGQSIWYDYMERRILENGELAALINQGDIRGLTSNPSIFNNAIVKTRDYDSALIPLAWAGYDEKSILEQLMLEDIRSTADLLRPLFDSTDGGDGYVSWEVKPDLAFETEKTTQEAKRLWALVKRPNVMIKIPATQPGLIAIRDSIAAGVNINITLIFSIERYKEVMEAYLAGLEKRVKAGEPIDRIHSVASFFVSRIDSKVDKYLEPFLKDGGQKGEIARSLPGKIAIANARLAYQEFRKVFESERFSRLREKGATLQRPLWASTSTKNPAYPDTMYVDELIGAHTVNTVPPQTLVAFREHGKARLTIEKDLDKAQDDFARLESLGISIARVTHELEVEGVQAFSVAFESLLESIKQRRETTLAELGSLAASTHTRIKKLQAESFASRFHAKDVTLWAADPAGQAEAGRRLGWLDSPSASLSLVPELHRFVSEVTKDGYTQAVLMGMGGSSLAPEVLSLIFRSEVQGLSMTILDSTDPAQVRRVARENPSDKTLFIVSSKSGGTAEVDALFSYFWAHVSRTAGKQAGRHFIAITDPGTPLEQLAHERKFRKIFLADPNVGGRYSALTAFGLVPAALMGIDIAELLKCAAWMASQCAPDLPVGRNPGFVLGAILGEAYLAGKDKLTLITDPELKPLGAWLEQLIAESSGKLGKGITPIQGEVPSEPNAYGADRLFVYLRRGGKYDRKVNRLRKSGQIILTQDVQDNYALGSEFYKWEVATATACSIIGVNAFDQPDVQDSKNLTREKISYYLTHQNFGEKSPAMTEQGISAYGTIDHKPFDVQELTRRFIHSGKKGDYVAINAYLERNHQTEARLGKLRSVIRNQTHLPTTLGFGPRYLHSIGQLYKGGSNQGLFLVITAGAGRDLPIPGNGISFGTLEYGQALGDIEALLKRKRRVLHIHLEHQNLLPNFIEMLR